VKRNKNYKDKIKIIVKIAIVIVKIIIIKMELRKVYIKEKLKSLILCLVRNLKDQ